MALDCERDGRALAVSLFPDQWGLDAQLSGDDAGEPSAAAWTRLERAVSLIETDLEQARRTAVQAANAAPTPSARALVRFAFAEALRRRSRYAEAAREYEEAIRIEEPLAGNTLVLARLYEGAGFAAYSLLKDLPPARRRLERGLAILEKEAPESLACARTLQALAQTLDSTTDAQRLLLRASALAEKLAPDTLTHASILYSLAWVTPTAEQLEWARHALAIRERLAPDSVELAAALRLVGLSLDSFGRRQEAEAHVKRAARLLERIQPKGTALASTLESLGAMAMDCGELADAERALRRALALRLEHGFASHTAITLLNLVDLLVLRRDLDEARVDAERARTILERELPDSEYLGYACRSLGEIALETGDVSGAETWFRRAVAIFRKVNPTGFAFGTAENDLGQALARAGRLEEARVAHEHALQLVRDVDNVRAATIQDDLAALALQRGDLDTAETWFEKALAARRRLAPGSIWEAMSEHSLGVLARRRGRPQQALEHFQRAVDALDAQARRLGGAPEVAAAFRAHYQDFYRDLEGLLLESGHPTEAFTVLDRGRARVLLALLAQRAIVLPELPADLERERREADAEHDAVVEQLATLADHDPKRAELTRRYAEARRRQDEVRARIRAAAPRAAALLDPEPLDLDGVRQALEPGTLLLAYSLGADGSRVYAVGPGPADFAVHDLAATEPEIRHAVESFRTLLERRRGPLLRHGLDEQARALGRTLVQPAAGALARARRLLIVPDGVLNLLPFSALQLRASDGRFRWLVEAAPPLHLAASVTLYAQLAERRGRSAGHEVVAFGDPAYAAGPAAAHDAAVARGMEWGLRLEPLPAARGELAALRQLAPGETRLWLGAEATEERAKQVGSEARIIHFATHGFVDEDFPLESGLALATPPPGDEGRDNGLLQAWEVFESVRIDADLVTLSACRTALGKEVGGEGLVGLTWAFEYAGARSVLASLWEVNDASTAELMRQFYSALRAGAPTAKALRQAQLKLLHRPATSAPFFWAAFQLVGDWR